MAGFAYRALPMGAVPEGYEQILLLEGVCYDEILYGENIAYKFRPAQGYEISELSVDEITTIDDIIKQFGKMNTDEIVRIMHEEDAYQYTDSNSIILYKFAEKLSIS